MSSNPVCIEILESAQEDLENIALLHLTLVGPKSARRITDKMLNSLERLEKHPFSGPLINDPDLSEDGFRFVVAGTYISIYKVSEDKVIVYHIFDGRTNYPSLFKRNVTE